MKITKKRLEEDKKIHEKMDKLLSENKVQSKAYEKLHRKYYIDNDDIRIYWQTY